MEQPCVNVKKLEPISSLSTSVRNRVNDSIIALKGIMDEKLFHKKPECGNSPDREEATNILDKINEDLEATLEQIAYLNDVVFGELYRQLSKL